MRFWRNSGNNVSGLYATTPRTKIRTLPTAKLRLVITRRLIIGSAVRNSQTNKLTNDNREITLDQQIQVEENQSASWPLSNTVCRVPSHSVNRPSPTASIRRGLFA